MTTAGPPDVIVTNFNKNYTGVSATAGAVTRRLASRYNVMLCGEPLPGLSDPVNRLQALTQSRRPASGRPFVIWHVRRNAEMQLALIARDILRLPVKIVFTSSAQRYHSAWPRFLISRMDAVISTSEASAKFVKTRVVIPHGADTHRFKPAAEREALWKKTGLPGKTGIVAIGRIRPEKGTDLFVQAMIDVLPKFPDATAVVIGAAQAVDKPFQTKLRADIAAAGLGKRIVFTGELRPLRLAAMLPAFSLLVAAPRYEGFGLTPLEAMASGVPFVASDTGAFRALSDEGRAGAIVPVGDAAALAEAVADWLAHPGRITRAGRFARRYAEENYSADHEADAIAALYEELWAQG